MMSDEARQAQAGEPDYRQQITEIAKTHLRQKGIEEPHLSRIAAQVVDAYVESIRRAQTTWAYVKLLVILAVVLALATVALIFVPALFVFG
jgi:hypothetical protein